LYWGLGTGDLVLGTWYWGLGTGDFVLGTWYWGLGTGDLVLGIGDLGAASLKPVKSSIQRSLDRYMEVIND
jgi:hypothetical protein